jgi:hypothetical protein
MISVNSIFKPYAIAEANANAIPTPVQKLGERPVAANPLPIFSKYGCNECLRLFNT